MWLNSLNNKFLSWLGSFKINRDPTSPDTLRLIQVMVMGGMVLFLILFGVYMLNDHGEKSPPSSTSNQDTESHDISKLLTPLQAIDERELWVNRIEKKTKAVQEEAEKVDRENQFLQKRLDILEDLFQKHPQHESKGETLTDTQQAIETFPPSPPLTHHPETNFPPLEGEFHEIPLKKRELKILHMGNTKFSHTSLKTSLMYLPAGSYSKAVMVSGLAASTATNAQANPQPVMLRLVDDGNLPRGFKSRVKDAILLGACYGDISSERVLCRLETMSWVEKDGTTVEKKVEGWVMGEDGRSGLRGEVVDRSSDVAREAFGAGLLSAVANFFKYEATSTVYPVSPLGQTNALKPRQAIQGAVASGAGNALDKLADFSIRRAEQMQPVIMVASGRIVDVVFKSGIDLSPEAPSNMNVLGTSQDISSESREN